MAAAHLTIIYKTFFKVGKSKIGAVESTSGKFALCKNCPLKIKLIKIQCSYIYPFIGDLCFTRRSTSFLVISAISSFNVNRL